MNNHLMQFKDPQNVNILFKKAVEEGASDVHLKPGSPPKMRQKGVLVPIPGYEGKVLSAEDTELLAHATMGLQYAKYIQKADNNGGAAEHDYAFEINDVGRFRANVYKTRGHDALVARKLRDRPQTLQELGINTAVSRLSNQQNGIILVTGATGSGKSTTMAAMIDFINKNRKVNVVSIEDPIEIIHEDGLASISQREIGQDTDSFASALRSAMRQDPDIILVGEIRDKETMEIALSAADTGHLVISTLHTTDTTEAFARIFTLYPEEKKESVKLALSSSLRGIIGQRLAPSHDGGRIAVNEILINSPEITQAILNDYPAHQIKDILREGQHGMQTFDQHLEKLYHDKIIDLRVALEKADNPEVLQATLKASPITSGDVKDIILPRLVIGDKLPQNVPSVPTVANTPLAEVLTPPASVESEKKIVQQPVVAQPGQPVRRPKNPMDLLD